MKVVHDIIAGITGFSEQRGDQITVETLPFENTASTPNRRPRHWLRRRSHRSFDLEISLP